MDKEILKWLIPLIITNIASIIGTIITWVKSSKMLPSELKGADLTNKSKELSIVEQYDLLTIKAVDNAVRLQERVNQYELDYAALKEAYELIKQELTEQNTIILHQSGIINQQATRIVSQGAQINDQEELIIGLRSDLSVEQEKNNFLTAKLDELKGVTLKPKTKPREKENPLLDKMGVKPSTEKE